MLPAYAKSKTIVTRLKQEMPDMERTASDLAEPLEEESNSDLANSETIENTPVYERNCKGGGGLKCKRSRTRIDMSNLDIPRKEDGRLRQAIDRDGSKILVLLESEDDDEEPARSKRKTDDRKPICA